MAGEWAIWLCVLYIEFKAWTGRYFSIQIPAWVQTAVVISVYIYRARLGLVLNLLFVLTFWVYQPTQEEKDAAVNGRYTRPYNDYPLPCYDADQNHRWVREGRFKFTFELRK